MREESVDLELAGKVVLVTGGARGIGRGIVAALAAEGAVPVVVGHDAAAGGGAYAVEAELTRTDECKKAVATTLARVGRIDGLVNNAGVNDGVGLEHGDPERFLLSLRRKSTRPP